MINLTNYKKVVGVANNYYTTPGYTDPNSGSGLFITNTSTGGQVDGVNLPYLAKEGKFELDISSVSGSYYVGMINCNNGNTGDTTSFNLIDWWLE